MIKYRIVLFFVGLLIVLMGVYPTISSFAFMQSYASGLPAAGSALYQTMLIMLGLIAIGYGFQGTGKKLQQRYR